MYVFLLSLSGEFRGYRWLSFGLALLAGSLYFPSQALAKYSLLSEQRVGLHTSSYITWEDHATRDRNPYAFTASFKKPAKKDSSNYVADVSGYLALNQPLLNHINITELSMGNMNSFSGWQFFLGRKKMPWSKIDEVWKLGAWQPLFQWNYIRPETQGLTGLFAHWKSSSAQITLYASPISIPNQGPSFVVRGGQFESASPWFSIPTQEVLVFENETPIRYKLEKPSADELLFKPGAAVQVRLGAPNKEAWLSGSYAYKPMSQLGLSLDGYVSILDSDVQVSLYPYIQYHNLLSIECGFKAKRWDLFMGMLADAPIDVARPADQSGVNAANSYLFSPGYSYKFKKLRSKVTVSYLKRWDEQSTYFGEQELAEGAGLLNRYPYSEAVRLDYKGNLTKRGDVQMILSTLYDFPQNGTLLTGELALRSVQNIYFKVGAEVLGVLGEQDPSKDFLAAFRANDRIYGSVEYVF